MTVKDKPKSIFLFCGDDTYSSSQKLNLWKTGFIKKYGEDSPIEVIEGKNLDLPNLATNIETVPFLAEKKLLIIKDFFEQKDNEKNKQLAKILEKTPDFTVIIFHEQTSPAKNTSLYKKIALLGTIEDFPEVTAQKATQWTLGRSRKEGIKINVTNANYLANYCGTDLWKLSGEIEKLRTYAQDKEISKEMIEKITIPSLTASVFRLTDSIAEQNSRSAMETFKTLHESGEDVIKILFMIVRHFRILIQVKDLLDHKENSSLIMKKLRLPKFVVTKNTSQSKNFSIKDLKQIYENLLEIDHEFKTGKIKIYQTDNRELLLAIEKFIINCCEKR